MFDVTIAQIELILHNNNAFLKNIFLIHKSMYLLKRIYISFIR